MAVARSRCTVLRAAGKVKPKGRVGDGGDGGAVSEKLHRRCGNLKLHDALLSMENRAAQGLPVPIPILNRLLQTYGSSRNLAAGRRLQTLILTWGHGSSVYLGNRLIRLFASCGSLNEAIQAFRRISHPDIQSWEAIISAHTKNGNPRTALELFKEMQRLSSFRANDYVYVAVLQACSAAADLSEGRLVHSSLIQNGYGSNVFVANSLVDMYAKCGHLNDARRVFQDLGRRDIVSWNSMISGYAQNGRVREAVELFQAMLEEGLKPDSFILITLLKACGDAQALGLGRLMHWHIEENGFDSDSFVGNTLIGMYGRWGLQKEARLAFDKISVKCTSSWNALITSYAVNGLSHDVLHLYCKMLQESVKPDGFTFVNLLNACSSLEDLNQGRIIHSHIIKHGLESDVFVGSALVDMYSKFGDTEAAFIAFNNIHNKNVVAWNVIIACYAGDAHCHKALELLERMQQEGIKPDGVTLVSALKACSSLVAIDKGKLVHALISDLRLEHDLFVASALVDMYCKCGSAVDARRVFDELPKKDVVTFNAMIEGYVRHGFSKDALRLFKELQYQDIKANEVTFISLLKACARLQSLDEARPVVAAIKKSGLESRVPVGNTLMDMFAKCGSMEKAVEAFENLSGKTTVSWNVLISGYVQRGDGRQALNLYKNMQWCGFKPDAITFASLLKACGCVSALDEGRLIHLEISKSGLESDAFIGSSLIDMYSNCRDLDEARRIFDKLLSRDVVSWNAMIEGCAHHGFGLEAFQLLGAMQLEGVGPDSATIASILKAVGSINSLEQGKLIHALISEHQLSDPLLGNALVDMYVRLGSIVDAREVFETLSQKSVASWNALIAGYSQQGSGWQALHLYRNMQVHGVDPDAFTFVSILEACGSIPDLSEGKLIHMRIDNSPFKTHPFVRGALMKMYVSCASLDEAQGVFDSLIEKDVSSWNSLIAGYVKKGIDRQAILLFERMQQTDMKPDATTFTSVLKACANLAAIHHGRLIHQLLTGTSIELDLYVGNSLVDMYVKCGSLDEARPVFDSMPKKDLVTWNALLGGYAQQGLGSQALQLFDEMKQAHVVPDDITFVSLLSACSHARLVDEGVSLFESMSRDHGITPRMQHYACMADLLSRAGKLNEAEKLISSMPFNPDASVWMPLLGACRNCANVELGGRSFESILKIDPEKAAAYVLMSNIYAAAGRWKDTACIRKIVDLAGTKKALEYKPFA